MAMTVSESAIFIPTFIIKKRIIIKKTTPIIDNIPFISFGVLK